MIWRLGFLLIDMVVVESQEVMVKILYGFVVYIDYFVGQE